MDKVKDQGRVDESSSERSGDDAGGIKRRRFIQAALIGAAATGCATVAQSANGQQSGSSGGNRRTGSGGRNNEPTQVQGVRSAPAPHVTPIDFSKPLQETWIEPWVWRPSDWTGQQLSLNVVENQNPGPPIGLGNIGASLFSYGGTAPGPTIRMRGDETLLLKLRNFLDKDWGTTFVNEYPDPAPFRRTKPELIQAAIDQATRRNQLRLDYCIGEHTNGVHSNHVTNLHTHGLHVRPGTNINGTLSDNIIQRIMSKPDWQARQDSPDLDCHFLLDREQVGEGNYEFALGDVMGDPDAPHPPGTHWYHPHSHGATHNQVSSGMAGFLLVEGDVDEAINERLCGQKHPNPEIKTGDWDYRERLMMVQRVSVNPSKDEDAPDGESDLKNPQTPSAPAINGSNQPKLIIMRPGAIERWRILNGSVDGRGYKRFMVVEGQYVTDYSGGPNNPNNPMRNGVLKRVTGENKLAAVTPQEVADNKQRLYQLAMDGVTLVSTEGDYKIKDLAEQNPSANQYSPTEEKTAQEALDKFQACFAGAEDGKNLKDCYLRPNEVYMAPANRTDVFFQAPRDGATKVYTVLAKAVVVHGDNYQQGLQSAVASNPTQAPPAPPGDIIIAYIAVTGDTAPRFDVMSLINDLPPAPAYLQPITTDELRVSAAESRSREDVSAGDCRSRVMSYSGWGAADFPLVSVPRDYVERHPHLEYLRYNADDSGHYLLCPNTRTMAINADLDLSDGDPAPPKKFNPDEPDRAQMLVNTAEEWVVYNNSIALWGHATQDHPGVENGAKTGYAIDRGVGQERNSRDSDFQIVTKAVDHPFHIHINPFYLLRVEVPDDEGNLVNILDEPRWQDVIWIPRNGGRVVFRSRFPDFIGEYVHHCHILLHEDNGMMHVVETTQYADRTNYRVTRRAASFDDSSERVSEIYGRPSLAQSFKQSISFVDDNTTGQIFPGFEVEPPTYTE